MNYSSKYVGQFYQMNGGDIYTLRGDGKFAYTSAGDEGSVMVQLTGFYRYGTDGNAMFQTTGGGWIRMADGWSNTGYSPIRQYSQKDAQYYVNKVIKSNAAIYENNLICARFANKLTEDQQFLLYSLQTRLQSRNQQLLSDGLCSSQQVASPPGYSLLSNNLATFMQAYSTGAQISGVGSITATIVVTAIVIASLATAAYFAYKYMASEAEKDVQFSDELTKILLEKLTPEEYQQLKNETQGIVTKQKLFSKFSGAFSFLKWGLVVVAGVVVYKSIFKKNII